MATRQPQPAAAAEQDRQPCNPSIHRQLQATSHPEQPWGAPDRGAPCYLPVGGRGRARHHAQARDTSAERRMCDKTPHQSKATPTQLARRVERIHTALKWKESTTRQNNTADMTSIKQLRGTTSNHPPSSHGEPQAITHRNQPREPLASRLNHTVFDDPAHDGSCLMFSLEVVTYGHHRRWRAQTSIVSSAPTLNSYWTASAHKRSRTHDSHAVARPQHPR